MLPHRTTDNNHGWNLETLSQAVAGRLRLASLPPLRGRLQPVARVVDQLPDVQPGDVLLAVETPPAAAGETDQSRSRAEPDALQLIDDPVYQWWLAQEAFGRGAIGVITTLADLEPWAGRCLIVVQNLHKAAQCWWQYAGEDAAAALHTNIHTHISETWKRLHRGRRNCGISTLPSLLG